MNTQRTNIPEREVYIEASIAEHKRISSVQKKADIEAYISEYKKMSSAEREAEKLSLERNFFDPEARKRLEALKKFTNVKSTAKGIQEHLPVVDTKKRIMETIEARHRKESQHTAKLNSNVSQVQQETRGLLSRIFGALVGTKSENNGLQHGAV